MADGRWRRGYAVAVLAVAAACTGSPTAGFVPPHPEVRPPSRAAALRWEPSAIGTFLTSLPPPRATAPVRLAFVGDINLGTLTLEGGLPPDSGRGLLAAVAPYLTGDLVVGNFESTLADSGTPAKCLKEDRPVRNCYAFVTPTFLAQRLVEAGFTHLNLANNHANDLGPAGMAATAAGLTDAGLTIVGPKGAVAIDTLRRGDSVTVVGLLGFTTYAHSDNLLDIERSAETVRALRPAVDVLLVTFHGGAEGAAAVHTPEGPEYLGKEPRGDLRRWSHAMIDAGADAVVGHGPHVLRGVEFYRGRPIAYSLGNFATYRGFNLSGPLGVTAVLHLELSASGRFREGTIVPLVQRPREGPRPDPDERAIMLVRRVSVDDFGPSAAIVGPNGRLARPADADPSR